MFSLLFCLELSAQSRRFTISGNITDSATGENMAGATVYVEELKSGTTANAYGFYSITIPEGKYTLAVAFVGYEPYRQTIDLTNDLRQNIKLTQKSAEIAEVVISTERHNVNVTRAEMSVEKISVQTLKRIPALMGEVDVIKAIQLLPGVQSTAEGSSGFSVRGGSHDQNLIILDEATVYNASHLLGFFSVFNSDAIKDVKLYKGDIPASFGGRLSSLLDVRSKDGNNQNFAATGGIGTISSRLTLEGPLLSNKLSYLLSGRRTYADAFLALAEDKNIKKSSLYFYDLNAKMNYRINDNNRLFFAAYAGHDNLGASFIGMNFGNQTVTLRWNHLFSPRLFSNFTLIGNYYNSYIKMEQNKQMAMEWKSKLRDYGFKGDFSYLLNPNNSIKFGYQLTHHTIIPGEGGGVGAQSVIAKFSTPGQFALEHNAYVANEQKSGDHLTVKYGLRYTLFQNIGNGEKTYQLENYAVSDSAVYARGVVYHTTGRLEPRLGMVYEFNGANSVKASYARTAQFIQIASNSAANSPLDVWFQATPNVKPQMCDQFAVGYFRNFGNDMFETSVELYYKKMKDVIDFKDHAELVKTGLRQSVTLDIVDLKDHADVVGGSDFERELRFGSGLSYGLELMIRKNKGKLNGWASYTLSKARRTIDEINDGKAYRSPFDKPNNISVVLNYELSRQWIVSANWVYASGTPVTYPVGRFRVGEKYVPIYSERNAYRYPAYHRLDLSATWSFKGNERRRFKSELNFSLYNAYGRHNTWIITFQEDIYDPNITYAEKTYLFSFVPSVTYNFKF